MDADNMVADEAAGPGATGDEGGGFVWCLSCGRVTRAEDWTSGKACPHCHAIWMHRFEWTGLRRIRPGLPLVPVAGSDYRLSDYS